MLRKFLFILFCSLVFVCPAYAGAQNQVGTIKATPYVNHQGYMGEVAIMVKQRALVPPNVLALSAFVQRPHVTSQDIQNFLISFDKWATWTDKKTIQEQKRKARQNTGSIGMALVNNKVGNIVCIPYPNGPAARAGVLEGDILLGLSSIAAAAKSFGGPVGASLSFSVERNGTMQSFTIKREKFVAPHIHYTQHQNFARIRIWRFDKNTPKLLAEQLQKLSYQPLVLDVRGNRGGNILAALNAAAEFLPQKTLLGISQVRESETYTSLKEKRISTTKNGAFMHINPIFIWQDELTASAAEAFIVALVNNGRALNMGADTFGKAHAQSVFDIEGNRLTLTTEALMSPLGQSWDGWGVMPVFASADTSLEELVFRTKELITAQDMPY